MNINLSQLFYRKAIETAAWSNISYPILPTYNKQKKLITSWYQSVITSMLAQINSKELRIAQIISGLDSQTSYCKFLKRNFKMDLRGYYT